jgi:hypothetical protein
LITVLDSSGLDITAGTIYQVSSAATNTWVLTNNGVHYGSANFASFDNSNDDTLVKGGKGSRSTNSCFTAISGHSVSTNVRMNLGGYIYSGNSCQQTAADGYSLSGMNIYYRIGSDFTYAYNNTAASAKPAANKYQLILATLTTLNAGGYAHTNGTNEAPKGTNIGSITAAYSNPNASPFENWWIVTSN